MIKDIEKYQTLGQFCESLYIQNNKTPPNIAPVLWVTVSILRYLGFIVTDSIFLLSTLFHAISGCTVNHLLDTLQLDLNLWAAQQHF